MRVLLATDGSKDSREATAFLKELPLPAATTVRIVAVVSLLEFALDSTSAPALKRVVLDRAQEVTEEARATLAPRGFTIETGVAEGDPRKEIVRQADEWKADLVVLGARGLGGVKRFLLGSVSDAVARHATCPVLIVKGRRRKLGSVLVAMDGAEDSFQAVRFLRSLVLPRQTRVRLLSVVQRLRYPTTAPQSVHGQLVRMLKELEAERRAELDKVLERAAGQLDDKITRVTRSTPTGDPAEEIVAAAQNFDTDLVVVGARGVGGVARVLLGSVSERVLHHARCPVLIVKERSKV
ncbi:MAG TPA: universal stress protein [Methylomirabilota bacterium]|jgi:nucleotide-binding universal stress UspA family protein